MNREVFLSLLALAALALSGCGGGAGDNTYRYRLTVEVDTPEGLRTGSSVIEVEDRTMRPGANPAGTIRVSRVRGEAVAVDLPDGQTLFALLRSESTADWASDVISMLDRIGGSLATSLSDEGEKLAPGVKVLPRTWPKAGFVPARSGYPMLVSFGDLDDPTSVERVDPLDLAATFGEGTSLKRITVQITDDPVTTGIEKRLGWLPNYYDKMLDGQRLNSIDAEHRLANDLSQGAFSKGILQ